MAEDMWVHDVPDDVVRVLEERAAAIGEDFNEYLLTLLADYRADPGQHEAPGSRA